jgi:hypothetical protein
MNPKKSKLHVPALKKESKIMIKFMEVIYSIQEKLLLRKEEEEDNKYLMLLIVHLVLMV